MKGHGMKRSLLLLLTLVMVFTMVACGNNQGSKNTGASDESKGGTTSNQTTSPNASNEPVRVGLLAGKTGLLEAYATQTIQGFELGLEYATKGTFEVAGRKIEWRVEDDQLDGNTAIEKAEKLLDEYKADFIIGTTSSAAATAILPLAEEYEKIFIIEPAVADSITGENWNRYIFRTGRNSSQDAAAAAASIPGENAKVAIYAQDYAFGIDGANAFQREAEARGHEIIHREMTAHDVTDHTSHIQKVADSGAEYVYVVWAGANTPWVQMQELGFFNKVTPVTGFPDILGLTAMGETAVGLNGFTVYNYLLPQNEVNDWLIEKHKEKYNGAVPDLFTAGGFAAAMAIVTALEKTGGDTEVETLIQTMEGMTFDSPKGPMTFRAEDHQALQTLYAAKLVKSSEHPYPVPELIRELSPEETQPPIKNQ